MIIATFAMVGCEDDDSSQPSGTATVKGNVEAVYAPEIQVVSAAVKSGVLVELTGLDFGYNVNTTTSEDGSFIFENVPAGRYKIVFSSGGLSGSIEFSVAENETVIFRRVTVTADGQVHYNEETTEDEASGTVIGLDQSQVSSNRDESVNNPESCAQVFTAGVDGDLVQVQLDLFSKFGIPVDGVTVTIRKFPGPNPGAGADLGSATISAGNIGAGWETATFSPGIPLSAGTKYSIICTTTAVNPPGYWGWSSDDGNPYPGGECWTIFLGSWTTPWNTGVVDFTFKTYMEH